MTSEPSSLCGCSRPLRETTHSCKRCGRDNGSTRYALSPQAQAIAELIADRVGELLESRRSRQKPSKYAAGGGELEQREQLEFGEGEA